MIRAVFLDVDDTLVDYQRAARAAFAAALGSADGYERFHTLDHYDRFLRGELDFRTARDTRMADFLALTGRADDVPRAGEIEQRRFAALDEHYALFDDVVACLELLRSRGLVIGLITNNESVHQRAKIAATGLESMVDVVVISDEVGVPKPDPRIFAHACELAGVEPHEALHVGDNFSADAIGAHEAGLHAVWLDRNGAHDGSPLDVGVVTDLHSLVSLLDS